MTHHVPDFKWNLGENDIPVTIKVDTCHIVKGSGLRQSAPSDLDYYGYNLVEFRAIAEDGTEIEPNIDEREHLEQMILETAEDRDCPDV